MVNWNLFFTFHGRRHLLLSIVTGSLIFWTYGSAFAQYTSLDSPPLFSVEVEAGPVWQALNNVEIPNDGTATRFSLVDIADRGPWVAGRVYFVWNPGERHGLRLLLAPLSITETGSLEQSTLFAGETYEAGLPVEGTYQFNSYRLTYRYGLYAGDNTHLWIGLTGKIRDAEIRLEQDEISSFNDDIGFVPLIHIAGTWRISQALQLELDVDGLASPQGRALDAALKFGYRFGANWLLQGGYRTLEGGADTDGVYTFAWFHYGVVTLKWELPL